MSTVKFACPICGQHINVDADQAGSHMECPRCFSNIVVPQSPEEGESKFVLTAAKVSTRVLPTIPDLGPLPEPPRGRIPYAAIAFVVVLCLTLLVGFLFRHRLFKSAPAAETATEEQSVNTPKQPAWVPRTRPALPVTADDSWKLDLADAVMPTNDVTGRINGLEFTNKRAMLTGGTLTFRESSDWPPDLGVSIRFFAKSGNDLAGKTITITPEAARKPEVVLRWWDDKRQPQAQKLTNGYAMRIQFGQPANGQIAGTIYLCLPDDYKSWVGGSFEARVRGVRVGDRPGDP